MFQDFFWGGGGSGSKWDPCLDIFAPTWAALTYMKSPGPSWRGTQIILISLGPNEIHPYEDFESYRPYRGLYYGKKCWKGAPF